MAMLGILSLPSVAVAQAVTYELEFEGLWEASHVVDESLPEDAHFTRLIGATHAASHPLWQPGALASLGIENVAEQGARAELAGEIRDRIAEETAGTQIESFGLREFPSASSTIDGRRPGRALAGASHPSCQRPAEGPVGRIKAARRLSPLSRRTRSGRGPSS